MRWPKRRPGDEREVDALDDTPAVLTVAQENETKSHQATTEIEKGEHGHQPTSPRRRVSWRRTIGYGVLPALALLLGAAAGFLKYQNDSVGGDDAVRESVRAASDSTVALLSYRPETVQKDLEAAKSRLTGTFLDAYTKLTHDVVIPGSQQKQISASATVPAAASSSATATHAIVLLFVDQTVTVGKDAPTSTASTVRVTLDKVDNQWLISQFDPV
jgi:Mce-associated membrane protein